MTNHRPRSRALAGAIAASGSAGLLAARRHRQREPASPAHAAGGARTPSTADWGGTLAAAPITSPYPDETFVPSSSVTLSAAPFSAADSAKDGLSTSPVTSVKFYASTSLTSNRLVGEATSAPWTVHWANVPAGDYSLTAVTTDKQGQSTTSDPVAIGVEQPSVVADRTHLTVAGGTRRHSG